MLLCRRLSIHLLTQVLVLGLVTLITIVLDLILLILLKNIDTNIKCHVHVTLEMYDMNQSHIKVLFFHFR